MTGEWDPRWIARQVERAEDGIWYGAASGELSYPADGHSTTREIEEGSFWYRHRLGCIGAAMERFAPAGEIFDVGGGNGYITKGLQDRGQTAVLLEPGRTGAQNARRRGVQRVLCASVASAGIAPGSLPAIGLFDVLEHVPGEADFLAELHRCLGAGGRLFVTVPAYSWLWSSHDQYMGHCRRYTARSLEQALRASGFAIDYLGYFFLLLPLPILLLRAVPSRLGLRRHSDAARRRDHGGRSGSAALLERLSRWEVGAIRNGRRIPAGASLLAVASKPAGGGG